MPIGKIPGMFTGPRQGIDVTSKDWPFSDALTQNIAKALAVQTYTLNHTATNSIFNIYDGSVSTYLQWYTTDTASRTTTLILDLGQIVDVHNTLLNLYIRADSQVGNNTDLSITSSYSLDNASYTTIGTTTIVDAGSDVIVTADTR